MKLASDLDTVKENPPPSVGGQLPIPREPEGKKKKKAEEERIQPLAACLTQDAGLLPLDCDLHLQDPLILRMGSPACR